MLICPNELFYYHCPSLSPIFRMFTSIIMLYESCRNDWDMIYVFIYIHICTVTLENKSRNEAALLLKIDLLTHRSMTLCSLYPSLCLRNYTVISPYSLYPPYAVISSWCLLHPKALSIRNDLPFVSVITLKFYLYAEISSWICISTLWSPRIDCNHTQWSPLSICTRRSDRPTVCIYTE